jgi:8-oxo-dGTP pyrophosphatase MutT (NUDIX family)
MSHDRQALLRLVEDIRHRTDSGLPGYDAHRPMMHLHRPTAFEVPPGARLAAVMICLFETDTEPHFVLIERNNSDPRDRHSGQMSFPGGKHDPEDTSLWHTAVRETHEETGIDAHHIVHVSDLTPLYIPVSNFWVHPFVGVVERVPQFKPDPREVAALLPTPLSWLLDPSRRQVTDLPAPAYNTVLPAVPFFDFHQRMVWGATAMILNELKVLLTDE